MTDKIKRTLYRLDKGFSIVLIQGTGSNCLTKYINKSKETINRQQMAQPISKDLYYTNNIAQVRD